MLAFILVFIITGIVFADDLFEKEIPDSPWTPVPNEPIGTPQGVKPGRVVWVWNPEATERNLSGFWWYEKNNNDTIIKKMFSQGIQNLTGEHNDQAAWEKLFKFFNYKHGKGNTSYRNGEKIAVKINLNNCFSVTKNAYIIRDNERDASPAVIKALLDQLVNIVGVKQSDITVFDTSRKMANWFYDRVAPYYPDVQHYVDKAGEAPGREKAQPSSEKIYFADGTIRTLPKCVTEADYLINIPLLKKHPINNGVTLSGKNLFGTFIEPVIDLHPYHKYGQILGNPAPQVDLLAHKQLGGKTILYIGDGLYGTIEDHRTIRKFQMTPFNGDWTNSLFFSQDPVAIDSVMYDFLHYEGPCPPEGSQNYLHQAALPPPDVYDPENDGCYLSQSLGVHEHWNISQDIFSKNRYSGPEKDGVDLIAVKNTKIKPQVVIIKPVEKRLYLFNKKHVFTFTFNGKTLWKEKYEIPITLVIGGITVEAEVNNVNNTAVNSVNFYLDGKLQIRDFEKPYLWNWEKFSMSKHVVKTEVLLENNKSISMQLEIWKIL